ncbi:hypothetical protein TNCV_3814911 [Trichonephila clavipes]|nr:hypothetical protein TNCV_3814911 [Trichonephila clavipes]
MDSAHSSDGSRNYIMNHSSTDSVCCGSFGIHSHHSTPFVAERNSHKAPIALFTLDWKTQAFAPTIVRGTADMDNGRERHCVY